MSLDAITKGCDFFRHCAFRAEIASQDLSPLFKQIDETLPATYQMGQRDEQCKERQLKTLREIHTKYPKILISTSASTRNPMMFEIANNATTAALNLCVELGGQNVLEVGDSYGKTPIFHVAPNSYTLVKRLTCLGAHVNIITDVFSESTPRIFASKTLLEHSIIRMEACLVYMSPAYNRLRKRCIKHLLGLGACIQKDSPLLPRHRNLLTSIYEEFLKEITIVVEKMQFLKAHAFPTELQILIFDYIIKEEDSETPEMIHQYLGNEYALDDEAEAYAAVKSTLRRSTSAHLISR